MKVSKEGVFAAWDRSHEAQQIALEILATWRLRHYLWRPSAAHRMFLPSHAVGDRRSLPDVPNAVRAGRVLGMWRPALHRSHPLFSGQASCCELTLC